MSLSYLSLTEEVVHRADAFAKVTMTRDSGSVPPSAFVLPSLLTAHRKDAAWEDAALAGRPRVRLRGGLRSSFWAVRASIGGCLLSAACKN